MPVNNKLEAIEPAYTGIPAGMLRRMGKAVRMGLGAALPLISDQPLDGIIIGTANGGMEDCIKFLNQMVDYDEGLLTPGSFVQSTPNAVASQIGLLNKARGYNITHCHGGLSFENAMIDAGMMLAENPAATYLLGGFDEISTYNYNIDLLGGWYKKEGFTGDLYQSDSPGSIAGEGVAMFTVGADKQGALAQVDAVHVFNTDSPQVVGERVYALLHQHLPAQDVPDLLLTGESGDNRSLPYYISCESSMPSQTSVARYKHFTGEFPTSMALALWLGTQALQAPGLPAHFFKKQGNGDPVRRILIYNNFKHVQHALVLLSV